MQDRIQISKLEKRGCEQRPLVSFCHGSIHLFLFRLGCWVACLYCSQVMADWTSSDRQILSSIESDTSSSADGTVNGFVDLLQGSSYGFGSWNSVYNYMTGGALNQQEKHSLTDFSMLSYLGMVAQSLGPLTYNYVNGEPVSSTWHSNRLSLYDALVGWDPTRNIESANFTNGVLNSQKQVLDKMDVMTNQLSTIINNQTNLMWSTIISSDPPYYDPAHLGSYGFSQDNSDGYNIYRNNGYNNWLYHLPLYLVPFEDGYDFIQDTYVDGYTTMYSLHDYNEREQVKDAFYKYYGNQRDPASMNPTTSDNAQSWISDAKSFARTASDNADEADSVPTDDFWNATFANGYVEGALVGRLDAVSDETSGITGPPRATFDVMRTTFNRVVDTEASGGFGFSFSVDFGNGASFQQTDTDIFEKAPAGFLENLRTRFTGYVTAWHNIVHVFLLVGLWLKTAKIVMSAFAGGDEV